MADIMKLVSAFIGIVALIAASTTVAEAGPIQTITLSGTLGNSWDGSPLFVASPGDLVGNRQTRPGGIDSPRHFPSAVTHCRRGSPKC